jgi:hypothetical protein
MENVLPPLVEKYGDQLKILAIETSDPTRYEVYLAALELFGVPPQRRASTVKLGLSLLFLTLGGWLAYSLLQLA